VLCQSDLSEPTLIKDVAAVVTLSPALSRAEGIPRSPLCVSTRLGAVVRAKGQLGIGVGGQALDLSLINGDRASRQVLRPNK
jgi:hypothetical protein